jgi:hypothetical protein
MRIPANYELPQHLHRIKSGAAFQATATDYGPRSAEYLAAVQLALKQQVEALGSEELAKFETALTEKVLKQAATKMAAS